jgi:multidrug resistance protein, MATE family
MRFFREYFKDYKQPGGIRDLLIIALPMMASSACDGIMTFTDRLFLSRLGPEYMNAAMGGYVTYLMLTFFFMGLAGYSNALVAQYYGAEQKHKAPIAMFQALLVVVFAWPLVIFLKPYAAQLFVGMDLPKDQTVLQVKYLDILVVGSIFTLIRQVISCYFTGIGRTKVVMYATVTALIVNVLLDYVLIFGHFGFEPMGIRGAAIATVMGNGVATLYFVIAYFRPANVKEFLVLQSFRFNSDIMRRLLRFGYPAGLEIFLCFVAFFFMTLMFQSRGTSAATATSIMFSYDLLSFIPLLGIEIATTSLAGRHMGANRPDLAEKTAWSAAKTGLLYSGVVLVLFLGIPETLVRVFHPDSRDVAFEDAVPLAISMIRIASLYVLAQAIMVALIGTLRGAGDTFYTMLVSVGANWTFLPMLYLTLYVLKFSVPVGWFVLVVIYLVFCWVMFKRFKIGKWKLLRMIN